MTGRKLYTAVFSMGVQQSMEYRFHFFLGLLGAAFPILVQYFIWTAVYQHSGESALFSYSYHQIILYTILAGLVSKLIATQFEHQIVDDIKNGGLNKYLIKPVSYFGYRLVSFSDRRRSITALQLCCLSGLSGYHLSVVCLSSRSYG